MGQKEIENKKWARKKQEFVFRHKVALDMVDGGRVLDIGCGDGFFMDLLRRKGIEVAGLDISDEAVRKCGEKGFKAEVFDASTGMLPFKDGEFDCAVMLDVLEHLYSPENLLAEAKRVSREYLVISVPNFNSLPARVQVLRGDVPENNKRGKHHFFWFNYKILKGLLYENQLKIIAIKTNTFWENKFIFKYLMKFFSKFFPSLFALSFVVKVVKTE